jgi:predicted small secreted protein
MKTLAILLILAFLTGCATVDGMRTDVGNGVETVADWIKPSKGAQR